MKAAIMQPYFLPYIGYWQLIHSVDEFVVYDNIEYVKKSWINRNRILQGDHDFLFTVPLKKDSDYLNVDKRYLSDDSEKANIKTLRQIEATYKKAPEFSKVFPVIKECFEYPEKNLFSYIYHSIQTICKLLDIKTKITISSTLPIDHSLKAEQKVLAICKQLDATTYINAIGGKELYYKDRFAVEGIKLQFIQSKEIEYPQFNNKFVPWLSIIDVLMFNNVSTVQSFLGEFEVA